MRRLALGIKRAFHIGANTFRVRARAGMRLRAPVRCIRGVLLFGGCAVLAFGGENCTAATATAAGTASSQQPDLFLFVADDLRNDATFGSRHSGNMRVETPNIDGFARGAVDLSRMYTPIAICAPARQALLSGLYPIRSGSDHNHGSAHAALVETLSFHLRRLGYWTVMAGFKHFHLQPQDNFWFDQYTGFLTPGTAAAQHARMCAPGVWVSGVERDSELTPYDRTQVPTPAACCARCHDDITCAAWNHRMPSGNCSLWDTVPTGASPNLPQNHSVHGAKPKLDYVAMLDAHIAERTAAVPPCPWFILYQSSEPHKPHDRDANHSYHDYVEEHYHRKPWNATTRLLNPTKLSYSTFLDSLNMNNDVMKLDREFGRFLAILRTRFAASLKSVSIFTSDHGGQYPPTHTHTH